jgi:hypothetical protein
MFFFVTIGQLVVEILCVQARLNSFLKGDKSSDKYHLPIILSIEMDYVGIGPTFLGAVDELTLVCVCSGICTATLLLHLIYETLPSQTHRCVFATKEDAMLCRRGAIINVLFGDFVEACYPFMDRSKIINISGYVASALSCAYLVFELHEIDNADEMISMKEIRTVPKSFAYVPFPIAIALSGHLWLKMLTASGMAFGIPFMGTLLEGIWSKRRIHNN